ncbi:DUF2934 domain-containing protein [Methylobacterium sp. JK268]
MDHFENSIRERAYALWERDGRTMGQDEHYWSLAEQELRSGADAMVAASRKPRAKAAPKAPSEVVAEVLAKAPSKAAEAVKAAPRRRRAADTSARA